MADPQALHAELLALVPPPFSSRGRGPGVRAAAAVRAVLELHEPLQAIDGIWYCAECSHFDRAPTSPTKAPCRTVKVIAAALGVTTDG